MSTANAGCASIHEFERVFLTAPDGEYETSVETNTGDVMISRTTLRRRVAAAGGYYCRKEKNWVLPGAGHNCAWYAVETVRGSLEGLAEIAQAHAAACARVHTDGEAEGAFLRSCR